MLYIIAFGISKKTTLAVMESITQKPRIKAGIEKSIEAFQEKGVESFSKTLFNELLSKKIKFPLLEYAAVLLLERIPLKDQLVLSDKIISLETIGGNTICGKLLQLRADKKRGESFKKAEEYIIFGNMWYVCDIIGERVFGYCLLTQSEDTIPYLHKLAKHPNNWMVRTIGVATHYAVKKGLKKKDANTLFLLLLSLSGTTDFHTKKGIGWAAKTIAKFHPEIIVRHHNAIYENPEVKQWFKTKIKIGLSRKEKYAAVHTS
ncbi:MAG TPA: DNA alkylation repair protein [Bacteroidia bacterium]